jgi:hypothetical protein
VQFGRPSANPTPQPVAKKEKLKKQKVKNDPRLVAAARELRDRWLEKVNEDPSLLLPPVSSTAKYDVARLSIAAPNPPQLLIEPAAIAA